MCRLVSKCLRRLAMGGTFRSINAARYLAATTMLELEGTSSDNKCAAVQLRRQQIRRTLTNAS